MALPPSKRVGSTTQVVLAAVSTSVAALAARAAHRWRNNPPQVLHDSYRSSTLLRCPILEYPDCTELIPPAVTDCRRAYFGARISACLGDTDLVECGRRYRRPDQPMWHRSEHLLSERYFRAQATNACSSADSPARIQLLGMACVHFCAEITSSVRVLLVLGSGGYARLQIHF